MGTRPCRTRTARWFRTSADPETSALQASQSRKLDEVIALLPDEYREVLILREMEDMSYRDIAEITGVPIGTVMSRLARARAMLKEKWMAEGSRMNCPETLRTQAYLDGEMDGARATEAERHIEGCAECQALARTPPI